MELTNLQIPSGWRLTTVRECCQIDNHLREPINAQLRKAIHGHYPYYGPTGILDYIEHYKVDGEYALIGEDGDHFLKYDTDDMTLLVSGKFNVNNHAHLVRGLGDCTTEWFFHFFRRANLYQFITRQGAGRYKLNRAMLERLPILVPSLPEQQKIAQTLNTWDAAIDLVEQVVAALRQRKKGLMQWLLTGKLRFPEFANSDWLIMQAGDTFQQVSRRRNEGAELLSVTQEQGVIPRSSLETRVTMPSGATDSYKLVEPGNFIISLRSFQGGIEYSRYRGLVSPAYTVLTPKLEIVDDFYRHLFKSDEFIARLGVAIIGIRDGKQINYADFASLKVPHPSITEQRAIAEILNCCDEEINVRQRQLVALRQQKKGLMARLLSGQVRVNVEEMNAV